MRCWKKCHFDFVMLKKMSLWFCNVEKNVILILWCWKKCHFDFVMSKKMPLWFCDFVMLKKMLLWFCDVEKMLLWFCDVEKNVTLILWCWKKCYFDFVIKFSSNGQFLPI